MADGSIVLVDRRTAKGRSNCFVYTPDGTARAEFCVGDGVADVLVTGQRIVVTYFDEGVFGDVPPSSEGLCVFSPDGELKLGYQSGIKNPVDVADCYCACQAGSKQRSTSRKARRWYADQAAPTTPSAKNSRFFQVAIALIYPVRVTFPPTARRAPAR
jgi:hypothetical protein